jgi:uncharacterized membrane protein
MVVASAGLGAPGLGISKAMRLWVMPLTGLLAGLLLAIGTLAIDRAAGYDLVSETITGNASAASALLSTIITATVTLLSVVLTVMTVAVQLAMGQFSPRIVPALLRDRLHRLSFAVFGATVAFGIVALHAIDSQKGQVPGLTVTITYLLTLTSLAVLVVYVSHAGQRLRASGLIDLVGDQLHREIDKRFPHDGGPPPAPPDVIVAQSCGVIESFDVDRLVAVAAEAECVLELCGRMGDFVATGAPLLRVHGGVAGEVAAAAGFVTLHDERTHDLDAAYGFRKLVDIAIRSASDDPTTTVEALHRIHDAMRDLAWRPFPSGRYRDESGEVRLIVPVRDWSDFVLLAFEEIRLAGSRQPQITRRLRAILEDLRALVEPERLPPLDEQLELLDRAVVRATPDQPDVEVARQPDMQGLG